MEESPGIDDFGRSLRILVISFHVVVAPVAHLSLYPYRTFLAGFRVEHLHFGKFKVVPYGVVSHFRFIIDAAVRHAR